jgi:methyltransferase (TIGR00027 family)
VDAPSTLADKRLVVERVLPKTSNVKAVWVPCDFEQDKLRGRLLDSGLDPTRPSVVAWIGVTMFLTRDAIAATFADLAALCAPRSQLIFDYVDADVVTGESHWPGARRVARTVARRGEPYRTGFESANIEAFMAKYGFTCEDHARTPALLQRYAPTVGNSSAVNDWLAICTARRS